MKKNKLIQFYIAVILLGTSCSWYLDVKKLGDSIYWDDKQIIWTKTDNYDGVGFSMIPPDIEKVKKNEKHVIIQTVNGKNQTKYWLIDKTMDCKKLNYVEADSSYWGYYKYSNVYGPLDSVDFFNLKAQKGVKIKW